jgi:hypothetical protein
VLINRSGHPIETGCDEASDLRFDTAKCRLHTVRTEIEHAVGGARRAANEHAGPR